MQEIVPVAFGLILGLALGYVRPSIRLLLGCLLAILLGVLATVVTGEFKSSWGYLLVDIPLVAVASLVGLVGGRRGVAVARRAGGGALTVDASSLERRSPAALRAFARAQRIRVERFPDAVAPATPSDRDYGASSCAAHRSRAFASTIRPTTRAATRTTGTSTSTRTLPTDGCSIRRSSGRSPSAPVRRARSTWASSSTTRARRRSSAS